mmetsp:Transcript_33118/g.87570  ORF Transcript_33118/g.87570 Transcript_33118/m.87570 type:complete len:476 (+) Transcript_33118:2-1429(+)
MKLMEHRARVPMLLTYRAVGSSTGQKEFVGNDESGNKSYNHFGAGDIPMSQDRYDTLMGQSPPEGMVHLPFALGAIGIFHNVPSSELGDAELKLNACTLAKIFTGVITDWRHGEIEAQNPGISVPEGTKIQVGHRSLGSSSTGGLAGYLHKKCAAAWSLGTGSTLDWPTNDTHDNFHPVQGSPGMQTHIKDTPYSIGYLDAGHGHDFGFAEVALQNKAGYTRTSKTSIEAGGVAQAGAAGVAEGVFPTDASADWSGVNLYDMPGDSTWPIVLVSYMYVKKSQESTNPKTAAALKAFISMILNNDEGLCEEFGFTAPSAELKNLALNAAQTIAYPAGMTEFSFETSTAPWVGMKSNVISMKRHSFDDYERAVMKSDIAALQASPPGAGPPGPRGGDGLRGDPGPPGADAVGGTTVLSSPGSSDGDGIDIVPVAISAVAVVLSLISCCFGFLAFRATKNTRHQALSENPQVYGSPAM